MTNIKFLLIIAVSVVQAILEQSEYGPKLQALVEPLRLKCGAESGIDEALFNKVLSGEFLEERALKVYMKCLLVEGRVMTDMGSFNKEVVAELLPDKIRDGLVKITRICNEKLNGITNIEDKAFEFFKCHYEQNPDTLIFF